ncbi:MAG TPA: hypothetical protein GX509_09755 [Firmicutes bacterium]|nr:hypothetical protein [Bacillota bacterium]HHY99009.1 hypothetical protein [Bacillota bacterium]
MTLLEVKNILNAEVLTCEGDLASIDVPRGCGCDLLSDVLAFAERKTMLLTGLTNPQVIRTAEMNDLVAVVFVRGKRPPDEVIEMAKERGIPLLRTNYPLFESCGLLFKAGLHGHCA